MKLTRNPRSWQQLRADQTTGMPGLGENEFTFSADFSEMVFPCQNKRFDVCIIRIGIAAPEHPRFNWNGDKEAPTITPSIGCDNRCGWHGNFINGELRKT